MTREAVMYNRIVHELRGPVGVALGSAAELERALREPSPYSAMLRRSLERILNVALRLSHLAAFEQGKVEHKPESVDLAQLVTQHAQNTAALDQRPAKLAIDPVAVPIEVQADPAWLGFCVDEIVRNALQHSKAVVRVSVSSEPRWARIFVEDDGPGFARPPDYSFDPDPDTKQGLGVSLAIAQRVVVDCHHGELNVTPGSSGGARVEIKLPVEDAP